MKSRGVWSSMMSPTVALRDGRLVLGLGSGGSNRIRSAVTQTILRYLGDGLELTAAVEAPRLHFEAGTVHASSAESVDGAGIRVLRPASGDQPTGALLQMALQSLARTQHQLMLLGCRSANMRMAAFLFDLSERQGDDRLVHLPMQRNDIADYLGMTFETVSRALRYLKDHGIVRLRTIADIEILNRHALEGMCE